MAQVQGEEIYLAHSGQEVDDNIDEVVAARGSEASLSARLADIVSDFDADQQRQETEIGAVAALGAKNLLENTVAVGTQTIRGVSVTVNADGSVDIGTGTVTGGNLDLHINTGAGSGMITGEKYTLSGCPQGGGASTYRLNATSVGYETGEGKEFTYGGGALDVYLRVYSGQTISEPLHFAPMIRCAEITDSTYAPYAPTNRELYEKIESDVVNHELVVPSGSILEYVNGLSAGFYTARQGYGTGTDKPISNGGFAYLIFVLSANTAQITAFETVVQGSAATPDIFTALKTNGTWGTWRRFTGEAVASLQSAPASLMQAGRIDAELTDAGNDEEDEER